MAESVERSAIVGTLRLEAASRSVEIVGDLAGHDALEEKGHA